MKALFVLHESVFIYGANRSITGVLQNIEYDFDLLICKSLTKEIDEDYLRKIFGNHLKRIYAVWLPRYRCHIYDRVGFISELSHVFNNIMSILDIKKRKKIIKKGKYDYVHLNSLVLFPVIDHNAKYVIHAREIINPLYRHKNKLVKSLEHASGIIYIDEATRIPLEKIICNRRGMVINNPFDMTMVENVDFHQSIKQYGIAEEDIVFAMLGQIGASKGSKFVIQSFMKHSNRNSKLLIVGNYDHAYGRECQRMSQNDGRVIFCGELSNTDGIYRISDYIIRGEEQFCIGRTIYEGLFSGTGVIIPGEMKDLEVIPEKDRFRDKIYFYTPCDSEELTAVIEQCSRKKQSKREYISNIANYMIQYNLFIKEIVIEETSYEKSSIN